MMAKALIFVDQSLLISDQRAPLQRCMVHRMSTYVHMCICTSSRDSVSVDILAAGKTYERRKCKVVEALIVR